MSTFHRCAETLTIGCNLQLFCRHEYIYRIVDYVLLLCYMKINNNFESSLILQNLPPHETK